MKYSDQQRIQKINDYVGKLLEYIDEHNITRESLVKDYSLQWLVTTPLYNIGEHVYFLSGECKAEHNDIPWAMISGLRHRSIHDYDGTNWNIIADVVFEELPALAKEFNRVTRFHLISSFEVKSAHPSEIKGLRRFLHMAYLRVYRMV